MWKKIRSNRNPNDTLFSELRKEFKPYLDRAADTFRSFARRKPKWIYGSMVFLLTVSAALSFTRSSLPGAQPVKPVKGLFSPPSGFDAIISTSMKIDKVIRLKQLIDSITTKGELSNADSLRLNNALDSLEVIQRTLKPSSHEN